MALLVQQSREKRFVFFSHSISINAHVLVKRNSFYFWLRICRQWLPCCLVMIFLTVPFVRSDVSNSNGTSTSSLSHSANRHPEYVSWLEEFGPRYEHVKYYGGNSQIALHWSISSERLHITVAVGEAAAHQTSPLGWLGFGITEAGGMAGADMMLFTAQDTQLFDAYAEGYTTPIRDICQDWRLHRSVVSPTLLIVEASRKLVTGDTQDLNITYDGDSSFSPTRVIFAYGNTPEAVSYHGPNNVAFGVVRFHGSSHSNKEKIEDTQPFSNEDALHSSIDLTTKEYPVPLNETTYEKFCFYSSDLIPTAVGSNTENHSHQSAVHVVAMQFIPDIRSKKFVHHLILYGSYKENDCDSAISPFYVWAPGTDDFLLPKNVGVLLGGKRGFKSFRLRVHFSNPNKIEGIIDNSGVRLLYTRTRRKYNAGMMGLGDPGLSLDGQPVGQGLTEWKFECPSTCTERHLGSGRKGQNTPITIIVFAQLLHMHSAGKRMTMSQIREGRVVREAHVDYYDYRAAGAVPVRQPVVPYEVTPGDSFSVSCFYEDPNNTTIYGKSFRDEMCISFMWYYPEVRSFLGTCGANNNFDPSCDGHFSSTSLPHKNAMGRRFGSEPSYCSIKSKEGSESETILS